MGGGAWDEGYERPWLAKLNLKISTPNHFSLPILCKQPPFSEQHNGFVKTHLATGERIPYIRTARIP